MIRLSIKGEGITLKKGDVAEINEIPGSRKWGILRTSTPQYSLRLFRPQEDGEAQEVQVIKFEEWPGDYVDHLVFEDEDDAYRAAELAGAAIGFDIKQNSSDFPIRMEYVWEIT